MSTKKEVAYRYSNWVIEKNRKVKGREKDSFARMPVWCLREVRGKKRSKV